MKTELNVSATATLVASEPVSTRRRAASRGRKRGRPFLPPFSRRNVSLPLSDYLAIAWWDAQMDPSASVRLMIHDEIRLHGTADRVTRMGTTFPLGDPAAYDSALLRTALDEERARVGMR